ncbi:phosphate signaling complex protein PhoU [Methylovirgula sp. 4M-Z18]|uniref:phosphate signaling complex protein PhoU n=1 Tax=Methylovirgula sp. 4M-Z18 TaxID=2293567 RepID=UPI000E2F78D3|nr:phosphate signaling complex protein PhoU [Methylovirgula sp. 4M-Z18]RFB79333.1 phosphate transport system regulatory protein PhoU [Methylovirgula sp. 4M-Z18]
MNEHIVKSFDSELETLGRQIAEMGGIAEKMLSDAVDALTELNVTLAQRVVETDPRLDLLQRQIEESAVSIIARRQPMAVDLRAIVAAIRVSGDLERIGDLAKNIAKRTMKIANDNGIRMPGALVGLRHMAELAAILLKDVLDAYAARDTVAARAVWERDAEIDALENSIFRDLLTFMMEDPRNITLCTHLLFCSKNIERIGDHCTNIAETVFYLVTGDTLPMDRPKGTPNAPLQAG